MTPLTWIRSKSREEQLELLAKSGSLARLAERLGCSESALRPIYMGEPVKELFISTEEIITLFDRYGSVRAVAFFLDVRESLLRKHVALLGLEITGLIDYSLGENSNAKGRRAELDFAERREALVLEDLNKTQGSQAPYDFKDGLLGRVNVKSSREFRYTAQCRQDSPKYWKFSTRGCDSADFLVCLCYDRRMENLVGFALVTSERARGLGTITLRLEDLQEPDGLSTCDKPE